MKKRLKELLALCMAGIMVFAMTTGFAAADDTPAETAPAKAKYTGFESVNEDPYKVFYPGDIIASDNATSGAGSSGITFCVVKCVPVADADIPADDWEHLQNNLSMSNKDFDEYMENITKVYKCWQGINWQDYAVLLAWYSGESTQYWFEVDTKKELSQKIEEGIAEQAQNFYEYSTNEYHYEIPGIEMDYKPEANNTPAVFSFYWLSCDSKVNLYDGDNTLQTTGLRYALRLPTANELYGNAYSDYGYHYNLKAIQKSTIRSDAKSPDGMPTGITAVKNYNGGIISDCLADTIFSCNQNDKYVKPAGTKSDTNAQISLMLEIESIAPNTYTVNFDSNGGEGTMNSYTQKYTNSDKDNLPANIFTKTGYSFAGWKIKGKPSYTESGTSGTPITIEIKDKNGIKAPYQELYDDQARYTPSRNNETVTLEAQWTANKYTVNYDTNGGTPDSIDPKKDVKWTDKVIPASNPTKNGFEFKGWECVKVDGKDITPITVEEDTTYADIMEAYAAQTVDKKVNDKLMNVTLQAQWEEKSNYTIKYNTNSSESTIDDKTGVKWTDKVLDKIKDIVISKTGYTFNGWKHKTTEVSDAMTYGYLAVDDAAESIILDAQWTANTYTVKFDANGGSGEMATQTLTYDKEEALNANEFTKTGYTFTGWNDEADGKGEHNYSNQEKVKNLATEKDAEITLYAQWTANDYTVKFNTDGGSDIADKTVKWEDNVLADVEDPTKDGFTFKGWKCGEAEVKADTKYSDLAEDDAIEELILTAQWEEVVVPVDEPDDKSPTGDNMNITLLMALLLLSGCGIAGAGLYRRNHVK